MAEPFIGEIRMFGGNFAPQGWAFCDGRILPISENTALFSLIGTFYGGDGQSTFGLPDLRSRVPIHQSSSFPLAASGGEENVTLQVAQLPSHTHTMQVSSDTGTKSNPSGAAPAASASVSLYKSATPATALSPAALGAAGSDQPHTNIQPFLCVSFIISLFGIFPSRN